MKSLNQRQGLSVFLSGILAVLSLLLLFPGHLAINTHEVDVLHAVDAAFRLSSGARQHIDFMSPLGALAFAPIAWLLDFGLTIDAAFVASNILVAILFLPAIIHVCHGRLGRFGPVFGVLLLILTTALIYGNDQAAVSMSMYYNRWAWMITFLIVLIVLRPAAGPTPRIDGVILGFGLGFLALTKMTYFLTLVPVVGIALLTDRNWTALTVMVITGLIVALLATLAFGGLQFWAAYAGDLMLVQASDTRPYPGKSLPDTIAGLDRVMGTLAYLAAVIALRKTGHMREGLLLLLFAPGFIFITYQNWGNDPKWLMLLAVLALIWADETAEKPVFGTNGRMVFTVVSVAALVLILPTVMNLALSPFRNIAVDTAKYMPLLADPAHAGLMVDRKRSFTPLAQVHLDIAPDPLAEDLPDPAKLGTATLPECEQAAGYLAKMNEIARTLEASGHRGKHVLLVDVINPLHLIGDFQLVPTQAPWYYGGEPGLDTADLVIVPRCPIGNAPFKRMIRELDKRADTWTETGGDTHFRVFSPR